MASNLILDRSDPGIDELVAGWKDGGDYEVRIKIHQDKSSASVGSYTVNEVVDESPESEVEESESEEMPMPKKMPKGGMVPKRGMMPNGMAPK